MQVASMVHIPQAEPHEPPRYMRQASTHSLSRPYEAQYNAASGLLSNPYSNHSTQSFEFTYTHKVPAPQEPPSPPSEEINKPSLPSISSLLGMTEGATQAQQEQQATNAGQSPEFQPETLTQTYAPAVTSSRVVPPLTPPLGPDPTTVIESHNHNSPPATSPHSTVSAPPYYIGNSTNNGSIEPNHQRHSFSDGPRKRPRLSGPQINSVYTTAQQQQVPTYASTQPPLSSMFPGSPYSASSGYAVSPYGPPTSASSYHPSPSAASSTFTPSPALSSNPYFHPSDSQVYSAPNSSMYAQRPLPSNFPPPLSVNLMSYPHPHSASVSAMGPSTSNPWQHHHYISPSSAAEFPQSQDRYVCVTCKKAFSRPSSLRIHNHSHTGEKPFACSHKGCGKRFSVRSNAKRHERGCHVGGEGASVGP
ncbi:hypothetical protein EJ06DRAFT_198547 [Trichodelitschia bisporula]|uniref:C2H2-type domain-containing protein n=1 Tax=Trichodelitschia bisporula TaxID=703511 RepID=A0A6G1I831_9PEZI|nr:hypothetical protein EJ06DRAFT_198547 [Trichodelitschia bisporula]